MVDATDEKDNNPLVPRNHPAFLNLKKNIFEKHCHSIFFFLLESP